MADHILAKGHKATTGKAYTRGQVVKLTAFQTIDVATAATDMVIGVCIEDVDQVKVDTGKVVLGVDVMGVTRCIAGAVPIAVGARVTVGAGGKITSTIATGNTQVGIALGAAATINDEIDVLLTPGVKF